MTWKLQPEHCRAARHLLGWTIADLARASEVSEGTVRYFEKGVRDKLQPRTERDIVRALEAEGIVWRSDAPGDPFVKCGDGTIVALAPRDDSA